MHSETQEQPAKMKNGAHQPGRMRIGELSRVSGVSRETIHYYLREGLLPPAEKVNARVSYFNADHLEQLLLIKQMRQAHLPLSVIRKQLEATQVILLGRVVPKFIQFLKLDGEEPELSLDSAAEYAHLTREQLAKLEALGVLGPEVKGGRSPYTQADADAAAAARLLLDQGIELENLRLVSRYAALSEQELGFLYHHLVLPALKAGRREEVSAGLGLQALLLIEAYQRRQFRRSIGMFSQAYSALANPLDDSPASAGPQEG